MDPIEKTGKVIAKAYRDALKKKLRPRVSAAALCKIKNPVDIQVPKFIPKPEVRKDDSMISGPFGMPVPGVISSEFLKERMHPVHKEVRKHDGVDIAAKKGTPVKSTGDGFVSFSGVQRGYGKIVEITHSDGIKTRYAHLDTIHVKVGDQVRKSQVIGTVGMTGTATGYHLHYEVVKRNMPINPREFM